MPLDSAMSDPAEFRAVSDLLARSIFAPAAHRRHNANNKRGFRPALSHGGASMSSRSSNRAGIFPAQWPCTAMIRLLVVCMLGISGPAFAQTTGAVGLNPVTPPDKEEVPRGGCTPIGVTASGEIVFPFTCKVFLERRRGPIEEPPKPAAQAEKTETPAPAVPVQAATQVKDEPAIQVVGTDASSKSSADEQKLGDDGKKRSRQAKRLQRAKPNSLAADTKKP